jgi:hypothetical protein
MLPYVDIYYSPFISKFSERTVKMKSRIFNKFISHLFLTLLFLHAFISNIKHIKQDP